MKTYTIRFTLRGETPLLMHSDSVEWCDEMEAWKNTAANKKNSRAGDDRSPAFRWIGSLYDDGRHIAVPSDNLAKSLMQAAANVPIPGRSRKTFKKEVMAFMMFERPFCDFFVGDDRRIAVADLADLREESDFAKHQELAMRMGFELFIKRAKIGTSKHIRVRPRFERWGVIGAIKVWDDALAKALPEIFTIAGAQYGVGDWRPGCSTPGPFGRFTSEVTN